MKKKRKWFVCLVCVLCLIGGAGCSKAADEENIPTLESTMAVEESVASQVFPPGSDEPEEVAPVTDSYQDEEEAPVTDADQDKEEAPVTDADQDEEEAPVKDADQDEEGTPVTEEPVAGNDEVDWFAAYNGEKIHRIISEAPGTYSPAMCSDIIFYEAEDGESMEEIIYKMIDAMIQPLTEESEDRPFTITAYRLEEQAYEVYDEKVQGVWLLQYLNGYYSYTGVDFVEMETVMQEQPDLVQDGMVPFLRQGSEEAFVFVLMREGNVYRLQRAQDMEAYYVAE